MVLVHPDVRHMRELLGDPVVFDADGGPLAEAIARYRRVSRVIVLADIERAGSLQRHLGATR